MMKSLDIKWIIHLFATLHLAVALACRSLGIMDEIWLTMLSIAMVVMIGLKVRSKVEMIAATAIITNGAGYLLGVYGAELFGLLFSSEILSHGVSTFMTTEIIGWFTFGFLNLFRRTGYGMRGKMQEQLPPPSEKIGFRHVLWLTGALVILLIFRILLTLLFNDSADPDESLHGVIGLLVSKSWIPVIVFFIIVLFIRYTKNSDMASGTKTLASAAMAVTVSAVVSLAAGMDQYGSLQTMGGRKFFQLFTVMIACCLIMFSIIYIVDYILSVRAAVSEERDKASSARYQYAMLKQQVNPHFLFNSLNILDCMVQEGKNEQASIYIHKLAGIYRYMLRSEERVVTLKDELKFAEMYIDLLRARFSDGFAVRTEIPEDKMQMHIIPCALQMLIENAIKHNRVSGETPLAIRIWTEGQWLFISNNRLPKIASPETSTKVGLNYLHAQYMNICGTGIGIHETEEEYTVKIPLIL